MEKLLKILVNLVLCFSMLVLESPNSKADQASGLQTEDSFDATEKLDQMIENLVRLERFAKRVDKGRLFALKRQVSDTQKIIQENGLAHAMTMNSYQGMILSFRYSETFLGSFSNAYTKDTIQKIKDINDDIIRARGFDEELGGKLVAGILQQMSNLAFQIISQEVDKELEKWIRVVFLESLGPALAAAKAIGDFPAIYEHGNKICLLLTANYALFNSINQKSRAYDMVTELIGLNELFKELYNRGRVQEQKGVAP